MVKISQKLLIEPSQYDWQNYWDKTAIPFRGFILTKKLINLIAFYSSLSSLKLLKQKTDIHSIIELGGGTGCLSSTIAKRIGLTSQSLTLIDGVPEAKKIWKELSGFGKYIIGDFLNYDFKHLKFDLVFSAGLLEHWPDKKQRLKIILKHSSLSKKYIMIRVPKKGGLAKILELKEKTGKNGNFEKHYTKKELEKEITQAGIKVIGTSEDFLAVVALAKLK